MQILAVNPGNPRKGTTAKKKGAKKMASTRKRDSHGRFLPKGKGGSAKKSKGKRGGGSRHTAIVIANPGNPSKGVKHYAKRAAHHARGFFGSLGLGGAAKTTAHGMIGIAAGLLLRKKFGKSMSAQGQWQWQDFLMAGVGALGAATIARHVFRASEQTSKNILTGGLMLIAYRVLTDQIVTRSDTLANWIGEEGEGAWQGVGAGDQVLPGDVMLGADNTPEFVMGSDGQWRPIDDSHRMLPENAAGMDGLVSPGALGDVDGLVSPGALGAEGYGGAAYGMAPGGY